MIQLMCSNSILQKCLSFQQKIDEFLTHLKSLDRPGSSGPPRSEVARVTRSAGEQPSRYTMNLVKQLVNW